MVKPEPLTDEDFIQELQQNKEDYALIGSAEYLLVSKDVKMKAFGTVCFERYLYDGEKDGASHLNPHHPMHELRMVGHLTK